MSGSTKAQRPKRTQGMNWLHKVTRLAIYLRDGLACVYCGATLEDVRLTVDHLTPYTDGGSNDPSNLVTCCHKCNSSRGARPWRAFARDVAQYLSVPADHIIRHVNNCRRRSLDRAAARRVLNRQPSWGAALDEVKERS